MQMSADPAMRGTGLGSWQAPHIYGNILSLFSFFC